MMKIWFAAGLLSISATPLMAQEEAQETDIEGAVAACGSITNREARLECFDSLANAVAVTADEAETAPVQPQSADKRAQSGKTPSSPASRDSLEPVKPTKKKATDILEPPAPESQDRDREREFLIIPKKENPDKKRQKKQARPSSFTGKIAKTWLYEGKIYIQLDNGEIWKQTSIRRPPLPEAGQSVEFSKRRFGGWFARFEGQSMKIGMTRVGG